MPRGSAASGGSKEAIELAGRPLLDYLVESLRAAPCSEIRLVTRPEKADVIELARGRGLTVIVASPESVAHSLALGVAGCDDEDIVCFGFPDCLWEPVDGFARLVRAVERGDEIALGLFRTNEPESYDPVVLADPASRSGRVERVEVKPERASSNLTWGCAAGRARALRPLEHERDPGEYFAARCRDGVVCGLLALGRLDRPGDAGAARRGPGCGRRAAARDLQGLTRSNSAAWPCPTPTHIVATP